MNNQNDMHPDDKKNMIIFIIASLLIWYGYSIFVIQPHQEAARKAQEEMIADQPAIPGGSILAATEEEIIRDRAEIIAEAGRVKIDNGAVYGSIDLRGGRIDDLNLHKYYKTLEHKEPVNMLSPIGTKKPKYIEFGWLSGDEALKLPTKDTIWKLSDDTDKLTETDDITLSWYNGAGLLFERFISIDENYMMSVRQKVTNTGGSAVSLYPYAIASQKGVPDDFQGRWIVHEGPMAYLDEELIEKSYKKMFKESFHEFKSTKGWVGISDKYWFTSFIPEQEMEKTFRFIYTPPVNQSKDEKGLGKYQIDVVGQGQELAAGRSIETSTRLFAGAKEVKLLEAYEKDLSIHHFDLAVDFGIFYFLTKPFFWILNYFNGLIGNMGIAIIILTVIVRAAVFPLANTSFRSFANMKKIAPEMTALREKYGSDKVKLQQEMVALYGREKVNPVAGCFPILMQIPIFFALYKTFLVTIEMRHAPFFGWITDLSAPDPISIFNLFGLMPWELPGFLMIGPWALLMLFAMLAQRTLNPPPQDPTQAMIANWMPLMMVYILSQFAVGLVIYWAVSNTLSVLQQFILMRSMGVEVHWFKRSKKEQKLEEMVKDGPKIHPDLEVIEHEVEDALFGDEEGAVKPTKPISKPKPKKSQKKSKKKKKK